MTEFIKMTDNDLRELKAFAAPIWRECYSGIVEPAHTEMLLSKYFDYENIQKFKSTGMIYEYIFNDNEKSGFIAYEPRPEYIYLDKLYLLKEYRGKHLSKPVFNYLSHTYRLPLRLNVNRNNERAITAYKANGFTVIKTEEIPQKGGFVNCDYVMERK